MNPKLPLRLADYLLLLVPATWTTLGAALSNPVGIPHVERLLAIAALLWVLSILVAAAGIKLGGRRKPVVYTTFMAVLLFTSGNGLVALLGTGPAWLVFVFLVSAAFWVFGRIGDSPLLEGLVTILAVVVISGPVIDYVGFLLDTSPSEVREGDEIPVVLEGEDRDLFLVVLDGHPGVKAMTLDFGGDKAADMVNRLENASFEVPQSAWSSYRATDQSIPSLLDMTLPTDGSLTDSDLQDLYRVIRGDNEVVHTLADGGYETYMIESGWSGSACGAPYDVCVASPWLDEALFWAVERSMIGQTVFNRFGYAFNVGSQASLEWLADNAVAISEDGTPSFVFTHLMVPHAPYFLDESCSLRVSREGSGTAFNVPDVSTDTRARLLADQIACVQDRLVELAHAVGDDDIIVVASDHGTDRRHQLSRAPSTWDTESVVERMNSLVAVSGLSGCGIDSPVFLPSLMRRVFECMSGETVDDLEPVMFTGSGTSLSDAELKAVLSAR
jgi:hypothetical protein